MRLLIYIFADMVIFMFILNVSSKLKYYVISETLKKGKNLVDPFEKEDAYFWRTRLGLGSSQ